MMNKEVVHFTHNDLDALGCMLNLYVGLPGINITTFHTNYRDLHDKVLLTEEYIRQKHIELLVISDVSFAEHRSYIETFIATGVKIIYLDHHIYPDGFFDGLNINYVHDTTKCATKITHEYFKNQGKHDGLDKLTHIINMYDLWQIEMDNFKIAIDLNEYYWESGIDWLYQEIINNNYRLPGNYTESVALHRKAAAEAIEKYKQKDLIHTDGRTTILFADKYFTEVLYDEFTNGKQVMIIANSYGVVRVRFNKLVEIDTDVKKAIKHEICGTSDVGHLNAFALKVDDLSFNGIMGEIRRIIDIINKNME